MAVKYAEEVHKQQEYTSIIECNYNALCNPTGYFDS